jgi:hypothetical protein
LCSRPECVYYFVCRRFAYFIRDGRERVSQKKEKKKIGLAAPGANATNPNEITAGRVMGLHSLR